MSEYTCATCAHTCKGHGWCASWTSPRQLERLIQEAEKRRWEVKRNETVLRKV
jgi:hypothetical protein